MDTEQINRSRHRRNRNVILRHNCDDTIWGWFALEVSNLVFVQNKRCSGHNGSLSCQWHMEWLIGPQPPLFPSMRILIISTLWLHTSLRYLSSRNMQCKKKRHFKASGKVCAHGVYVCVKLNKKQAFSTCLLAHDKFTIKSSKDAPGVATIKRTNYIEMQTSQ